MHRTVTRIAAVALAAAALGAVAAWADGFIIIDPFPYPMPMPYPVPPWPEPRPPEHLYHLDIKYHHVDASIEGQLATTRVDESFHNPYAFDVEGTYIFPLPKGAAIDRFSLKVDGKPVEGEMLNADEAALEYRKLVNQNKDPAILEYMGRGAFKARIYPIPAESDKRVEITYAELLPYDGGVVKYQYPLDTERFSGRPLDDVELQVKIKSDAPLETVFSPSHKVQYEQDGPNAATVKYHAAKVTPADNFVLYYSTGNAEIGARVWAEKPGGEDAYFLLVLTPPPAAEAAPEPKDLIFVLDVSGSMAGEKLEQVRAALDYCLGKLGPGDRFNVISFNEQPVALRDGVVPASADNVAAARAFAKKLSAGGGTNVDGALAKAFAAAAPDAAGPTMVVFLTDGKPTVGERNAADIVANAVAANAGAHARVFAFGVGYSVKTELLDDLARKNGGTAQYVEPGEDVELAVTTFYNKVSRPILANADLAWEGVEVYDLYPPSPGDIFAGTQLTVMGRLKGELSDGKLALAGERGGRKETFTYALGTIAGGGRDTQFIAPLWATRKIGFLLEQIKLEGEDADLIKGVVALSKRYGIPTPYTSYLVTDTGPGVATPAPGIWRQPMAEDAATLGSASGWLRGGAAEADGAAVFRAPASADELSVRESKAIGMLKSAVTAPSAYGGERVRYVDGKSFRRDGDAWRDLALEAGYAGAEVEVKFGSEEYFELLRKYPGLAPFLALGSTVDVLFEGVRYRVVP